MFDAEKPEVISVLDWELSTLGDPLADLASSCMAHYLPPDFPVLKGIGGGVLNYIIDPHSRNVQQSSAVEFGFMSIGMLISLILKF